MRYMLLLTSDRHAGPQEGPPQLDGVREYGARDIAGRLWSFMQPPGARYLRA